MLLKHDMIEHIMEESKSNVFWGDHNNEKQVSNSPKLLV